MEQDKGRSGNKLKLKSPKFPPVQAKPLLTPLFTRIPFQRGDIFVETILPTFRPAPGGATISEEVENDVTQ